MLLLIYIGKTKFMNNHCSFTMVLYRLYSCVQDIFIRGTAGLFKNKTPNILTNIHSDY